MLPSQTAVKSTKDPLKAINRNKKQCNSKSLFFVLQLIRQNFWWTCIPRAKNFMGIDFWSKRPLEPPAKRQCALSCVKWPSSDLLQVRRSFANKLTIKQLEGSLLSPLASQTLGYLWPLPNGRVFLGRRFSRNNNKSGAFQPDQNTFNSERENQTCPFNVQLSECSPKGHRVFWLQISSIHTDLFSVGIARGILHEGDPSRVDSKERWSPCKSHTASWWSIARVCSSRAEKH